MPISFELLGEPNPRRQRLRNVGDGGICFSTDQPLQPGREIRVRIPLFDRAFEFPGRVAWCRSTGAGFEVGVCFASRQQRFTARMLEQLVYIEDYRAQVRRAEGRRLTSEQAAAEWIERFAGQFPGLH